MCSPSHAAAMPASTGGCHAKQRDMPTRPRPQPHADTNNAACACGNEHAPVRLNPTLPLVSGWQAGAPGWRHSMILYTSHDRPLHSCRSASRQAVLRCVHMLKGMLFTAMGSASPAVACCLPKALQQDVNTAHRRGVSGGMRWRQGCGIYVKPRQSNNTSMHRCTAN